MKQTIKCALVFSALLALMAVTNMVAATLANDDSERPAYLNERGVIVGIERTAKEASILVKVDREGETEEERIAEEVLYHVFPETILYSLSSMEPIHSDNVKTGQHVVAAYETNTPVLLSLPPQISPQVIVVDDTKGERSVLVDYFDETGLNSAGTLKINISEETEITDTAGNKLAQDHALGHSLIVFYSATTRSLPPQTSPDKIVCLTATEESMTAVPEEPAQADEPVQAEEPIGGALTGADALAALTVQEYNNVRVVKLRDLAELLGYSVAWDGDSKRVTLMKEQTYFILDIGKTDFESNNLMFGLNVAPFIVDDYTYVEEQFVENLLG